MQTRRQFLAASSLGAGGVFFSTFLNQLRAADKPAERPLRVVFFLQGNGLYPDQIQPETIERPKQPGDLEDRSLLEHSLPESIAPLEPLKDRLTMIHGLSSVVARASHSTDFGCLGCYPGNRRVFDATIDAVLARRLGGIFPHVGLGVTANAEATIIYNLSASRPDKKLPTQCQPQLAYQRLFGAALSGEARKAFDTQSNVLDFLADDVRRLQSRLNAAEKEKLDYYLEAFESMSDRQSALVRVAERIRKYKPTPSEKYAEDVNWLERLEAQFEVAAGALIAGLTNVVTISSCSGLGFSGGKIDGSQLGIPPGTIGLHSIGHGQSFCGKTSTELHVLIRERHMQYLAGFAQKLASIPEGDGSMLDNTLIVYTSDHGEQHHPRNEEWPLLLIGDLVGRLNTRGRYLRYPWYGKPGHRTVANLYTSLLRLVGDNRPRFGIPDVALRDLNQDGPLDELPA